MINLEKSKLVWLVDEDDIGREFDISVRNVSRLYRHKYSGAGTQTPVSIVVRPIEKMGVSPFSQYSAQQIESIMQLGIRNGNDLAPENWPFTKPGAKSKSSTFFRLVFVDLWARRKVILPPDFTAPVHQEDILDQMVSASGCASMVRIRSVNTHSALDYKGDMSRSERELRMSHWFRLLLSTTAYDSADLTESDMQTLRSTSAKKENEWLLRYYPSDFILFISESVEQRHVAARILTQARLEANAERERLRRKARTKKRHDTAIDRSLRFLEGQDHSLAKLVEALGATQNLRADYYIYTSDDDPNDVKFGAGFKHLPDKVKSFAKLLNSAYASFVRSKRYQQDKSSQAPGAMLMAYASTYLFKFFEKRDGHLAEYPATLNDFSCELFVAGDQNLVDGLVVYSKKRPQTLVQFMNLFASANGWGADTLYARIKMIDGFFAHLVENQTRFANADRVRNAFNPSCYPRVKKRYGTTKKPIPRQYFATFMSMLYSMEVLAMHLNDMADGEVGGVLNGELVNPTIAELTHLPEWAGIWGFMGNKMAPVDLDVLSYCPIFYHDQKPVRFKYIPRFYRAADMDVLRKVEGGVERRVETRIIMNDVRITQLMCETGIRQQHLIWLDRDEYDCHVDVNSRRALVPLYVTTDKAHSSWSAITSRRVMDLLRRQSEWYDKCASPEFSENVWYGGTAGSAFGQFRPLFRLQQGIGSWDNHEAFTSFLLCLQYFIKVELQDDALKDFVWRQKPRQPIEYIADHSVEALASEAGRHLKRAITPHGLRAGFVSEAIKFLPPFLVGQYFTGQTEELVYYYAVHGDDDPDMSFEQVLAKILLSNQQKINEGLAPNLTNAVVQLNLRLQQDIQHSPGSAIDKYRLFSLERAKNSKGEFAKNGVDLIRLEEATELAFNSTHICPFGNNCTVEAIAIVGGPNYCAGCPFAIRGAIHLPAISAQKDKYKELMLGVLGMIRELLSRTSEHRSAADLERLEQEHDHFASQALLLEAIELQLVEISQQGDGKSFMVQRRGEVVEQYARFGLPEEAQLIKRLVDAQTFPDLNSSVLESQLALMRCELLMDGPDARNKLRITSHPGRSAAHHMGALIGSMVTSGAIDEFDVYRICANAEIQNKALAAPSPVMLGLLG
ncbi:hypothetical protein AL062_00320 [Pseudomonas syringae pv. syringae]|uniref:hypothetical protein n=1 Tax=Pseudomonas syringae TaxID=317 RepID=UPI00076059B0|nr:hypothetical protein [Pseudomonas syringae]KWS24841.1 hypothetical protein AL062_00320 [Pseudomonas syringae pv. syringae]